MGYASVTANEFETKEKQKLTEIKITFIKYLFDPNIFPSQIIFIPLHPPPPPLYHQKNNQNTPLMPTIILQAGPSLLLKDLRPGTTYKIEVRDLSYKCNVLMTV